jgi:hypothetical protein
MIDDAKAKGLRVDERPHCVRIWTGKTCRSVGITMWEDGTATRADISLSETNIIRTIKAMRQLLGLAKKWLTH